MGDGAVTEVPFLDLATGHAELREELDEAYRRVLDAGQFVLGPSVEAFERAWAAVSGAGFAVGVGSGYDALVLGLRALGVGPGDEVLVPSNTYIATWLAVSAVGAVPVPVEPDQTHDLDPALLEAARTPRTRAVLPVHLYGHPADLGRIVDWAHEHGLVVLSDAAQAHGARYRGEALGGLGDAVAWSFYPSKNLGALGDGGAVTTHDPELARRVAQLRNYGSPRRDLTVERGVNSRLDELQAALLLVKLARLEEWNDRRSWVADRYLRELTGLPLGLPVVSPDVEHAWHLFVVRAPDRDALRRHLSGVGVPTVVHYPVAPGQQPAYRGLPDSPIAARLAGEVLSLPMGPHLTEGQQTRVITAVRGFYEASR
jgi:dTDP-4-amino-4,6-dideoxygalactose transaminase